MAKYCLEKYPKGSFPGQQSPGRYIDGIIYENLKILAKNIINDMTYLSVCFSSTYEVGAGKSNFMQQIAEAYTELINQYHGKDIEFKKENIIFNPEDLMERAFQVPKYSCLILDEWEDSHYWSKLGMTLRKFFRKCRQLNLFIIIIIPNFFQLPMSYAVSRSIFAIDVRFEGEFQRGYFRFYNFNRKKNLYIKGKKTQNYGVVKSNFFGRFTKGYAIPDAEYREMKRRDMEESDKKNAQPTPREVMINLFKKSRENSDLTLEQLSNVFGVSKRTLNRWNNEELMEIPKEIGVGSDETPRLLK